MPELRFRLRGYTPELLWAARWELFEFRAVTAVVHDGGDIVSVAYEGEPDASQWIELLDQRGFHLELLIDEDLAAGAA